MIRSYRNNQGFTLIELILVIVILGVLSAVAIPKYKNVKENAEYNSLMKIVYDTLSSVPGSYRSAVDLAGKNPASIKLKDLISINGKGWTFDDGANRYIYKKWTQIRLDTINRRITVLMSCKNFTPDYLKQKCVAAFPKAAKKWEKVEIIDF